MTNVRRKMRVVLLMCLGLLFVTANAARAQQPSLNNLLGQKGSTLKQTPPEVLGLNKVQIPFQTPEEAVFALDEPIDPKTYVLGPGDVMGVNIRGGIGAFYQSMIAPDGSLVVPNMPVIKIGGLTLASAIDTVVTLWGGVVGQTQVDLTLLQLRRVRVSVGGSVQTPGQYIVTPADRASTAIELAGGLIPGESSKRRAVMVLQDGTRIPVDLLRFQRSGAKDANPRMQAGAHLTVEPVRLESPKVEIGGGVVVPGSYEYLETDHVYDLVQVAGGFREEAMPDSVVLTHFDDDGTPHSTSIDLQAMLDSGTRGPALKAGDLVFVKTSEEMPERASVTVQGEVRYPGRYPIVVGETRLADAIKMAGGLTDHAYLRGARVWKERSIHDFRNTEAERIDSLVGTERTVLESEYLKYFKRSMGRDFVRADFVKLYHGTKEEREKNNVLLFDSLVVNVPREIRTVLVAGQVNNPGFYPYHPDLDYKDYIKMAGGYGRNANRRQTRLVPYESSVWKQPSAWEDVEPGDMIFVPEKSEGTDWETFRDVFTVILQTGTLITLILRTI